MRTCARWARICSSSGISRLRLREGRASKSRLRGQSDEAFITFDHARFALAYRLSSLTPMSVRTLSTIAHTRPASDILDFIGKGALIKIGARHNQTETIPNPSEVRFGSKADIGSPAIDVRFDSVPSEGLRGGDK